jgi:NhaP-type Na+/H+ or K+/H+ antiporter
MGGLFSSASSSALGNLSSNILKGNALTQGMGTDMLGSVGGAAAGIAAHYAGRGITKAMGNSNLGKFTGAAAANVGGTLGGAAISNALGMASGAVNPLALGMTAVGAGLGAMNGPSKEYGGKYGDITKTMDTIYDIASVGVNAIPGIG